MPMQDEPKTYQLNIWPLPTGYTFIGLHTIPKPETVSIPSINNKSVGKFQEVWCRRPLCYRSFILVEDFLILSITMAPTNYKAKNDNKSSSGADAGTQGPSPILALVQEAATLDSNSNMKQAAAITLKIVQRVQVCICWSCDHPSITQFS